MADVAAETGGAVATGLRKFLIRLQPSITPYVSYLVGLVGIVFISLFTGLLVLWLIHQFTIWLSQNPVQAFHGGKTALTGTAIVYDILVVVYDAIREVVILVLPVWNGLALYVVQPAIFVILEVLTLTFSGRPYISPLNDDILPFEGHSCLREGEPITEENGAIARFCGDASVYASQIGSTRNANNISDKGNLAFSPETARRLSEAAGDTILAQIGLAPLLDGLQAFAAALLTITASVSDIFYHLAFEVLSVALKAVFQAFMLIVRSLGAAFSAIFSDGTFMEILGFGIEFLMIFLLDFMLPSLMRVIDAVFCLFDLMQPDGWQEQLDCIEATCYAEASTSNGAWFPFAVLDPFQTFTSVPMLWDRIVSVVERVTNKLTGQAYDTTAAGKSDYPDFGSFYFPKAPGTDLCIACFNCKVSPRNSLAYSITHSISHTRCARRCQNSEQFGWSQHTFLAVFSMVQHSKELLKASASTVALITQNCVVHALLDWNVRFNSRMCASLRPLTQSIETWMDGAQNLWLIV